MQHLLVHHIKIEMLVIFQIFQFLVFIRENLLLEGEGGVLTTNNKIIATWLKKYKSFGLTRIKILFEIVGTNLKFSNINAIFALSQLEILDKILHKKKISP